ncbi:MAG TPA: glutathione S-transferase N-terminal domain-containing protein [Nevskiaceae bacterium]|nr:glutathione S-transferase N-terminal domain-containing protein [Nevskiaceae bacterium]
MPSALELGSSLLASTLRGWRGTSNRCAATTRPAKPLELYEFEACPFCRLVREALTELDLDVLIYPCPKGGQRFRPQVRAISGRVQFPFLVDPNNGRHLYESAEIIDYLRANYGGTGTTARGLRRSLAIVGGLEASAVRGRRGYRARASTAPAQPLELYSFESSPYSRLVREVLCELELPYLLHNGGKARWTDLGPAFLRDRVFHAKAATSPTRAALHQRTGRVQFPYLIDPNTGTEMYESDAIRGYLENTYAA